MSTPPQYCSAANTLTLWPSLARSPATVRPAGPPPTTATFLPVLGGTSILPFFISLRSQSARNLSSLPMPTGSFFLPTTQFPSHWFSYGHTLPHTAGGFCL